MTKNHLLGMYLTKFNHIKLAYASLVMWAYPDTPRAFKELHMEILNNENRSNPVLFPDMKSLLMTMWL